MRRTAKIDMLFWIMKICATLLGTTLGNFLSVTTNLGSGFRFAALTAICLIPILSQIGSRKFRLPSFWAAMVAAGSAGAVIVNFMARIPGITGPQERWLLLGVLLSVLALWRASEKTLSLKRMHRRSAEMYFWVAAAVSCALGLALATHSPTISGIGAIIGLLLLALEIFFFTRWSRVTLFWASFVLTTALVANLMSLLKLPPTSAGLGSIGISAVLACILAVLVSLRSGDLAVATSPSSR